MMRARVYTALTALEMQCTPRPIPVVGEALIDVKSV